MTRSSLLLLSSLSLAVLAACGGGDEGPAPGTTPVTPPAPPPATTPAPPPPSPPATPPATPPVPPPVPPPAQPPVAPAPTPELSNVELAQTHVIPPAGREMQSPNDVQRQTRKKLMLVADRAALLMVQPAQAVTTLVVRARLADGRTLGPLTLNAPAQLPRTDGSAVPYATNRYSVLLPREWVQIGARLEVGHVDFSSPRSIVPVVTPATTLKHHTVPIYLFGARHDRSVVPNFSMASMNTAGYRLDQEYREKLPVARLETITTGAVTLDRLAIPGRNDDRFCYPAMSVESWADWRAVEGDTNARTLRILGDMRGWTANRDGAMAAGFYGFVQANDGTRQVAAATGGGLGGGGVGVSGGDYRPDTIYSAIFNHEMGHAYGLPHADAAASAGDDPYPMGTKSGSTWGYDSNTNQLLTTREFSGQSCNDRTVNGVCWQRTPMSGGDDDRNAAVYRWNAFSDYQAALMQEGFLDKMIPDASAEGGYRRWDRAAGAFAALTRDQRIRSGADVVRTGQSVQTVIGTVSHFNRAPTASTIVVTPAWTGNLPRQIDPTVQADLDTILSDATGGWSGYYCVYNGCDYTLVATYADGSVLRHLLPIGYRRFNSPADASGYKEGAQDARHGDNFATYAVNLPTGRGGLSRVQVFSTPFASTWQARFTAVSATNFGGSFPLVNEWTPTAGASGGSGAPGTTSFDAAQCRPGATVRRPAR